MEMARSILKSMSVPGCFWVEAVRHSVHLRNRLPTKAMGFRTPFAGWCGKKPQLGHLRVFGCRANVRPGVPHLKKLDDRSPPMVYFGVEDGSKAHRLYNPNTKKIVVSRDVIFEENVAWKWDSEFGEKPEFTKEKTVDVVVHSFTEYVGGDDENQLDDQLQDSGGAKSADEGIGATGEVEGSVQQDLGAQSDTIGSTTI
jgi:hypothetical protein